ncbi:UNVERIFIED_CONTAM: hypothetical protein GTU68_061839 [Idotea baltica]|nr:hypothetical protein [Idotea baltica]
MVWPCKQIGPGAGELSAEYEGRIKVAKVDVDSKPERGRANGCTGQSRAVHLQGRSVVSEHGPEPSQRPLCKAGLTNRSETSDVSYSKASRLGPFFLARKN